ncbi:response regulator [Paenibacillus hodogayensis]|uniref:Response regulator n=1 Tax=Paenibacillus hodogayensis TaxID=279208 RepID=A0ABV5W435_9BACL
MYNLLIVDDEPRIVNGLYEQFLDWKQEELSVFRAYSAAEALRIAASYKMDIVLTDIQMPGMNGIELQRKVLELWPRCKVLFLSGYSHFDYVQSAMREGGMDYILKVEGDEQVLAAVGKAIVRLQEERMSEQFIHKARQQLQASRPLMQKEYLTSLLLGELSSKWLEQSRFDELEIPLSTDEDALLVYGRLDRWPNYVLPTEKSLLMYAVQNIASEYLSPLRVISFMVKPSYTVWLIQPAPLAGRELAASDWEQCLAFVRGTMSDIQEACKTMLKLPVSFALSGMPCTWRSAAVQFMRLEQLFQQGFGHDQEMLLSDARLREPADPDMTVHGMTKQDIALRLRTVKQLETYLLGGQQEEFLEQYDAIAETARLIQDYASFYPFLVEIENNLASMMLSYMNQWGFWDAVSSLVDTNPLLARRGVFESWGDAEAYYRGLAVVLFTLKTDGQIDRTQKILTTVNQYIEQHLARDLSLEALADHVYLHPNYLSRLYKQIAGTRISDHIKEKRLQKAKELLANPRLKIQEVATSVGFESAHYFTKVFKKELHMTPQEFRERQQDEKI